MNQIAPDTPLKMSRSRVPEIQAKTSTAESARAHAAQAEDMDFFARIMAALGRAGLGRFFGVAPKTSTGRADSLQPVEDARAPNAEQRQAEDLYQAMKDITGY